MASLEKSHQPPASFHPIARLFKSLTRDLRDAYRPELHYMRGPGPKWQEKHASRLELADLEATKSPV